jgi:VWFA-related protein
VPDAAVRIVIGAAALAVLAGPSERGHAEQSSFRSGTDLVPVYVTVVDEATGRLVTDLDVLDFEIRDDGQIRPVALFSNEVQPFSAVVLLDRSASMSDHFDLVRNGAFAFVRQMRPADRIRIGSFSERIELVPDAFTGDRRRLERILDEDLPDSGPSPVWEAIDRSMNALLPVSGRRVVLVFSDGHDDPGLGQGLTTLRDLLRRTRVNDIMVYAIGFAAEVTQASRPVFRLPRFPGGAWPPSGGGPVPPRRTPVEFTRVRQPPDPGLRELAEESGGGYFQLEPGGDLEAIFARVATELHKQYWLGFTPARLDGKVHDIDVKVRRRGLEVRARRSYVATPPSGR